MKEMAKKVAKEMPVLTGARALFANEEYNQAPVNSLEPELITQNLRYCGCYYNDRKELANGKVDGDNIKFVWEVVDGKSKGARFNVKAYALRVSDGQMDEYTKELVRQMCHTLGAKPDQLDDASLIGKVINARVAYDIDIKTKAPKTYEGNHLFRVFQVRAPIARASTAGIDADLQ